MIISSAIRLENGSVFVGKRHSDCFKFLETYGYYVNAVKDENLENAICGFINDKLQFLTREEAYYEAFRCMQCKCQGYNHRQQQYYADLNNGLYIDENNWKPQLSSEDLW